MSGKIDNTLAPTVNDGFIEMMERIKRQSEKELLARIKRNYALVSTQNRGIMEQYFRKYSFWGSLDPSNGDYDAFERRAKAIKLHADDLLWLYGSLGDTCSHNVLYAIIRNWVEFDLYALNYVKERKYSSYFDGELIECSPDEVFVDIGAYVGDTAHQFIQTYGAYKQIYCYEITPSSFGALKASLESYPNVYCRMRGASDRAGTMYLSENEDVSSNRLVGAGHTAVPLVSLDEDIDTPVTFIKMDIEGGEKRALMGLKRHIQDDRPKLAVSVYHSYTDIFELPRIIMDFNPRYKLYLRYYGNNLFPTETVVYALEVT